MNVGDFHFLRPAWLLAVPALLALAAWCALRRGRDGAWSGVIDPALLARLRLEAGGRARSPWLLLGLVWALAAVALAGPAWEHERTTAYRAPSAWVIVLDLSPSMNVGDLTPDRASRARFAVDDLLAAVGDGQVALVVFGDDAYTVTPLTDDVATIRALLPPLAPAILPAAGDSLAPGLVRAGELLHRSGVHHGQVIVLTDGFDDERAALAAAGDLRRAGATVHLVAVGTPQGAPLPDGEGGFVRDASGRPQLARVDLGRLRALAAAGGGELAPLDALPGLVATLRSAASVAGGAQREQDVQVARWRDGGVWLLPLLLVGAALLARRGWL